jgi:hypothetical protein
MRIAAMIEFYGGYQVYSESGVDLTLLRENLTRTLAERWQQNCDALPFLDELRNSGRPRQAGTLRSPRRSDVLDLPGLLRQLADHQVEHVVIGGLAMIAQGSVYLTRDLDICYARTPANIRALAQALAPLHPRLRGAPVDLPFKFDPSTIQAGLNFTLTTDLGDVDVLGEVSGIGGFPQALAKSEERTVYGLRVRVLTIEGLIAAKKAAGRGKDLQHLLELEELKKLRDSGN